MEDAADLRIVVRLCGLAAKWASKASAVACSTSGRTCSPPVSAFIFAASPARLSSTRKCRLSRASCWTRRWLPSSVSLQEGDDLAVADARVVLGAGNRQLPGGDAPVQQVPGPGLFLGRHALAQLVGVETRHQRIGADAPAPVIEPQRRLAGNQGQPVAVEVGLRMRDARGVVPHLAGRGDPAADALHQMVQLAVGIGVGAVEHGRRQRPFGQPVGPGFLVAAVDAAHGQHHHRRGQSQFLAGLFVHARGAADARRRRAPGR